MENNINESVVFAVYGTLKEGYSNHNYYLRDAKFIGHHVTEPEYTMYQCGFPIVVQGGTTPITVELWETKDPDVIRGVNSLEGFTGVKDHPNNWYDRKTIYTPYGPAEMFYQKHEPNNRNIIANGIWGRGK